MVREKKKRNESEKDRLMVVVVVRRMGEKVMRKGSKGKEEMDEREREKKRKKNWDCCVCMYYAYTCGLVGASSNHQKDDAFRQPMERDKDYFNPSSCCFSSNRVGTKKR